MTESERAARVPSAIARAAAARDEWLARRARSKSAPAAGSRRPSGSPAPPCSHGGTDADIVERCPTCNGGARHVRECEVHDRCTWEPVNPSVMDCAKCRREGLGYTPAPGTFPLPVVTRTESAVLVTGGIGDFLTVEAVLPPEERDRLEAVYYAAPAAAEIEQLWRALPNYPRLKRHVRLPTGSTTLYSLADVERAVGPLLPSGVRDLSIGHVFARKLPYCGSSFLTHPVASPDRPSRPYAVVVPRSTWFAPKGRNFDADDWSACTEALEVYDLLGVVLSRERGQLPAHPRLIDRQGSASILEAVELLKGAAGYLGIDSWASVLAAKMFPAHRLAVKCVPGCHGWNHRQSYFAPRSAFPWLTPKLKVPEWN